MKPTAARDTREALMNDFDTVISETEQLLASVAGKGVDDATALRATLDERIADAGTRLARLRGHATHQVVGAARATDRYVRVRPWRALGIGAAAAALAGVVVGAWIARR